MKLQFVVVLLNMFWIYFCNFFLLRLIFFTTIKASKTLLNFCGFFLYFAVLCHRGTWTSLFWPHCFAAFSTLCIYLCLDGFCIFFSLMWPTKNRFSFFPHLILHELLNFGHFLFNLFHISSKSAFLTVQYPCVCWPPCRTPSAFQT